MESDKVFTKYLSVPMLTVRAVEESLNMANTRTWPAFETLYVDFHHKREDSWLLSRG